MKSSVDTGTIAKGISLVLVTAFHCPGSLLQQVNEKSCRLRMATYRDGVKRKGDKIGMGV